MLFNDIKLNFTLAEHKMKKKTVCLVVFIYFEWVHAFTPFKVRHGLYVFSFFVHFQHFVREKKEPPFWIMHIWFVLLMH